MIINGHGENFLRLFLSDDVLIQKFRDVLRFRDSSARLFLLGLSLSSSTMHRQSSMHSSQI